jgi:hypothetical protein
MDTKSMKFVAPKITILDKAWITANCPCILISIDSYVVIKPFAGKKIKISNDIFEKEFNYLKNDDMFVYTPYYPDGKINISEFYIEKISISDLKKYYEESSVCPLIVKAHADSYNSKGNNTCVTISEYKKYKEGEVPNKLERIGDPIYNRSSRHSPPIPKSFTRAEFEKSSSFPAPIGIREEDFALPSEQNKILIELLEQIFNSKNAPPCPDKLRIKYGLNIIPNSHKCRWCSEIINIDNLNQEYCSKEHSINLCHRNPEVGTKPGNVYFGHCSCNREQGGYSEEQHIEFAIRLAKYNPLYREQILKGLE